MNTNEIIIFIGIIVLSAGTYLIRYNGFYLAHQISFQEKHKQLMSDAACVLLFTLAVFNTLFEQDQFSGMSKLIGVLVAIGIAWKNGSLVFVILSAVGTTAILRFLGIK